MRLPHHRIYMIHELMILLGCEATSSAMISAVVVGL